MFPLNQTEYEINTRFREKYTVAKARTDRLKNSPIPYMQKLLNSDIFKKKWLCMDSISVLLVTSLPSTKGCISYYLYLYIFNCKKWNLVLILHHFINKYLSSHSWYYGLFSMMAIMAKNVDENCRLTIYYQLLLRN